ncbi:divergent polysaccharide deacetylase family protein [Acetobacter vaccinii]|uniref:Divergent polysaccharide deacetylase family protein n=1 Tax=Acetobacter vaccinii TaxID=2592655 RepID=A0A5C1YJI8_9PROT|nr:divergent polysaccharide deacetylase family protein [Acetobacter vaccinii]QEO16394.1 divergent polysaccharide deacetylase family protein [Acetobacter vaccinii]
MNTPTLWQQLPASGRLFLRFWGGGLGAAAILALSLQVMGPPRHDLEGQDIDVTGNNPADKSARTGILPPQTALLARKDGPGGYPLPVRGPHGQTARRAYAAPAVDVPPGTPMVALLLDGITQADSLSDDALTSLPGPISIALSSGTTGLDTIATQARQHQHETFITLPVQAQDSKDPATKALTLLHSPQQNMDLLTNTLSSLEGYVGVASTPVGGDDTPFTTSEGFRPILESIDSHGLLYLDGTPGTPVTGPGVLGQVDVRVNADTDIVAIDIQLLKLQQLARQNGRAIGVIGPLRPVALACLRAWIAHLKDVGIALVPVSQIVLPVDQPASTPAVAAGPMRINLASPPPRGGQFSPIAGPQH